MPGFNIHTFIKTANLLLDQYQKNSLIKEAKKIRFLEQLLGTGDDLLANAFAGNVDESMINSLMSLKKIKDSAPHMDFLKTMGKGSRDLSRFQEAGRSDRIRKLLSGLDVDFENYLASNKITGKTKQALEDIYKKQISQFRAKPGVSKNVGRTYSSLTPAERNEYVRLLKSNKEANPNLRTQNIHDIVKKRFNINPEQQRLLPKDIRQNWFSKLSPEQRKTLGIGTAAGAAVTIPTLINNEPENNSGFNF